MDSYDIEDLMSEFNMIRHERVVSTFEETGSICTTYVDIANYAFLRYYVDSYMELRDVTIRSPLNIDNDSSNEIYTVIKKEKDCLMFIIVSKDISDIESENKGWTKHAEGLMYEVKNVRVFEPEPGDIKARCKKENKDIHMYSLNSFNAKVNMFKGFEETLIEFDIPQADIKSKNVEHPSLVDCILDVSISSIAGSGWRNSHYGSLKYFSNIPQKSYIYIKKKNNWKAPAPKEICFDITAFDESKNIIFSIENYIIHLTEENCKNKDNTLKANTEKITNPGNSTLATDKEAKNNKYKSNNAARYISNMSWREMSCIERSIALLLGQHNDKLINYFKLITGANKSYNLGDYGITLSDGEDDLVFYKYMLKIFGYSMKYNNIGNGEIHDAISYFIDKGQHVSIWFDEYYLFYTPFYLRSHTSHSTVINGYSTEKKVYSICNHDHLSINNNSQLINYDQFYSTYDTVENIYSNLEPKDRFIITLDPVDTAGQYGMKELSDKLTLILNFLADSNQSGKDIEAILKNIKENGNYFDLNMIDTLYIHLGGKELLIDTLLNYFKNSDNNGNVIKNLGYKIIQNSNDLVKSYISEMYKGGRVSLDKAEETAQIIKKDTADFFKEVLKVLVTGKQLI